LTSAKQIMKEPISVSKDSSVADALRKIVNQDISRVLITDDGEPVGIITERDIGIFLLTEQTDRNIDEVPVTEIMKRLVTVNHSTTVQDCAKVMNERNIGSIGVNFNGNTKGIITRTDLVKYYFENYVGEKRVGDVMTVSFVSCYEDQPIYQALATMIDQRVSRIIVKNKEDRVVGIMSFRDLFRLAMVLGKEKQILDNSSGITVFFSRKGMLSKTGFGATALVREAMTRNIVTVEHDDDLAMGCNTLIENNVNGATVLVNNKITGILSKTDVVRAVDSISKKKKDTI